MIRRSPKAEVPRAVEDIAGEWFARRRSGRMSEAETAQMNAWLRADLAHRQAMEMIERAWVDIEDARRAPEILALRARGRGRWAGLSQAVMGRAMAACLALVIAGAGAWSFQTYDPIGLRRFSDERFVTAVGEKTTVTLPDGSRVTLNTDTKLRTVAERGRRIVYLDEGQAFFQVARDARRPFVVKAAGRSVVALGTAFDVRVDGKRFEVTLVEGKVRVETPVASLPAEPAITTAAAAEEAARPVVRTTEMLAGDRFVASTDEQWVVADVDTSKPTNWLIGRLKFEGEPIGSVAAEFGRYSRRKIVIDDPALARRPISGAFEANDAQAFAEALEIAGVARIASRTATEIRLVPPAG